PRSDQGRPHGIAERSLRGEPAAHHRGDGGREARGEGGGAGDASGRHGRHGGHGRHDVTPGSSPTVVTAGTRGYRPGVCRFDSFLTASPCSSSVPSFPALV